MNFPMRLFDTFCKSVIISTVIFVFAAKYYEFLNNREYDKQKLACEVYGKQVPFGSVFNESGCFIKVKMTDNNNYLITREAHEEIAKDIVKMSVVLGVK